MPLSVYERLVLPRMAIGRLAASFRSLGLLS